MARKKLVPLDEFELTWTAEEYDHEQAKKFIHSLLGQVENRETDLEAANAKVAAVEAERDSYREQANKAEKSDPEEIARLKKELTETRTKLDTYDVEAHPKFVRLKVQAETGLSESDMKRIVGDTYDEMLADAEEFKKTYVASSGESEGEEDSDRGNPGGTPRPGYVLGGDDRQVQQDGASPDEVTAYRSTGRVFIS